MRAPTPLGEFEVGQVLLHERGKCVAVVTPWGLQSHNMLMPNFDHGRWAPVDPGRLNTKLARQLSTALRLSEHAQEMSDDGGAS